MSAQSRGFVLGVAVGMGVMYALNNQRAGVTPAGRAGRQ